MEVRFSPERELQIRQVAVRDGKSAEELVQEAVARLLDHDAWLLREVDVGVAQAECGRLLDHDEWWRGWQGGSAVPEHKPSPG